MRKGIWVILVLLLMPGCATTSEISNLFSQARKRAVRDNFPIVVMPHGRYPGSGEGFIVEIEFENTGPKTIKEVIFSLTPSNKAGKPIACPVKGVSCIELKAAGPFRRETGYYSRFWANAWYSPEIYCLQIDSVTVVYLDDTTQTFDKPEVINNMVIASPTMTFLGLWTPPRIISDFMGVSYIGTCEPAIGSPPAKTGE